MSPGASRPIKVISGNDIIKYIFFCKLTTLTVRDLWDDPVAVADLLQLWDDVREAAVGGLGSGLSDLP